MGVGADDETGAAVAEKADALLLAGSLAMEIDHDGIGRLAHYVRTQLHGDKVFYNRNRHINYTNVCALSCKFCSFYRKRGEEGTYEMPVEQVVATAKKAAESGATEVHVVGGLHPWLKFDYYLDMLRGIRADCPELHINVDEPDHDARRFYERHGFATIEPGSDHRMLCYIGPTRRAEP